MTSRLQYLRDYLQRIKNIEDLSLLEIEEFIEEGMNKTLEFGNEEFSEEERELIEEISIVNFAERVDAYEKFIDFWNKGKISPNKKELECLKKYRDVFFDKFISSFDRRIKQVNNSTAEILKKKKQKIIENKKILDRLLQQNSSINNNKNSKSSNQQIQNLQAEINSLNTKLNKITDLILQLLEKQNDQTKSISETEKWEVQQKLNELRNQKEEIQDKIEQKQVEQKEEILQRPTQTPAKEFNWWYVAIPTGVVILIAGIIITYLLYKKSKKR